MKIRQVSEYILVYILWGVSSAAGLWVAWMVRSAYLLVVGAMTMNALLYGTPSERFQVPYIRTGVDRFGVVILAVAMVAVVVFIEYTYRTGLEKGLLWRRFVLVTAIEFGVVFIMQAIQMLAASVLGVFSIWSAVAAFGVLALTGATGWLVTKLPGKPPDDSSTH